MFQFFRIYDTKSGVAMQRPPTTYQREEQKGKETWGLDDVQVLNNPKIFELQKLHSMT